MLSFPAIVLAVKSISTEDFGVYLDLAKDKNHFVRFYSPCMKYHIQIIVCSHCLHLKPEFEALEMEFNGHRNLLTLSKLMSPWMMNLERSMGYLDSQY